jgi:hypothetical protein
VKGEQREDVEALRSAIPGPARGSWAFSSWAYVKRTERGPGRQRRFLLTGARASPPRQQPERAAPPCWVALAADNFERGAGRSYGGFGWGYEPAYVGAHGFGSPSQAEPLHFALLRGRALRGGAGRPGLGA